MVKVPLRRRGVPPPAGRGGREADGVGTTPCHCEGGVKKKKLVIPAKAGIGSIKINGGLLARFTSHCIVPLLPAQE